MHAVTRTLCATSGWAGVIVHRRSACTARVRKGQPPPPRCCPPRCCSAHPGRRHCPSRRRRRPHRTSRYRRSVAAMGRPPGLLHARQLRSANAERARDGERRCAPVSPLLPSTSASVRQVLARDCQKGFSGDSWPSSCHDRGADLGLQDSAKDQAAVRQSQDVPTACGESAAICGGSLTDLGSPRPAPSPRGSPAW